MNPFHDLPPIPSWRDIATVSEVGVQTALFEYIALDRQIDRAETDALDARWEFGRRLLAERIANGGKQLPKGRMAEICLATGKSPAEVSNRIQFAEEYQTPEEVSKALETFGSWYGICTDGLGDRDADDADRDERYTPVWLFEAMGVRFDVDLAAPPGGVSYIPADSYYTKDDDALVYSWAGRFAWCNPPYSVASTFGRKWLSEITEGVWLGPISHGTDYLFEMLGEALVWIPRDLRFIYRDRTEAVKFPLFLGGFGPRGKLAVRNLVVAEPDRGAVPNLTVDLL